MTYTASFDHFRRVRLTPSVSRAFWSNERAWPGAPVRMHVETRFVPDGTPLKIEVRSADPEVTTVLQTIDADVSIEDSRCIVEHTIDWDEDALDEVLEATRVCGFYFVVSIEKYGLELGSTEIYVPFEPFTP